MLNIIKTGITDYRPIWQLQKELFDSLVNKKRNSIEIKNEFLILTQHNPVITIGFHGNENNLLLSEDSLRIKRIDCIRIERGGDVTCHEPGQLVAYPIIDMEKYHLGVKDYVMILEETVIRLLEHFGIKGERIDGATGVWIGKGTASERKICAMGIKCRNFITMHGIALNVNNNLSTFSMINPCGFIDKGVTSIKKEKGMDVSFSYVADLFSQIFSHLLSERC